MILSPLLRRRITPSLFTNLRTLTTTNPTTIQQRPTETMTKIVGTMGPSSDKETIVNSLLEHGLHVARLNFSHAGDDYTYPKSCLNLIRDANGSYFDVAASDNIDVANNTRAVLVDTKGPEIRTGPLQGNVDIVEIGDGAIVDVTIVDVSGDTPPTGPEGPHRLNVDYQSIAKSLEVGGHILLDDGLVALEVLDIDEGTNTVQCVALNGGPMKRNKGVNLPDAELDLPALTDKDKRDLVWACTVGADYVAASFIRTKENVTEVVDFLSDCCQTLPLVNGAPPLRPLVISKIESKEGVDNFDGILEASDGIMVARGDLGVEIPFEDVFKAQKVMVEKCNIVGKPVIVATQMLDSMQRNPRPTRAEVTDVGTAVLDGADAVMLSGETAAGKYPLESVKAMASVVNQADGIKNKGPFIDYDILESMSPLEAELDSVAESAVRSARDMNAKVIICITADGEAARSVARHRPNMPVLAFCTDVQAARRLQLHRSVIPLMLPVQFNTSTDKTIQMGLLRAEAIRSAKEFGYVRAGDRIVTMDCVVGKEHDLHEFSCNMKMMTI